MDAKSVYKISYGLYVLTASEGDKDNGCIINTLIQLTSSPMQIAVTVNKANLTHDMIKNTGKFNVLRFNDENEVYLRLHDNQSNTELYTMQLKDFMKENNITVDGINEATVGIRIRFNGTTITVKPWNEEVIRPGL